MPSTPVPPAIGNPPPRLYNPRHYTVIAVLLSSIPVFLMSLTNAKVLPNGPRLRRVMRRLLVATLVLVAVEFLATLGNSFLLARSILDHPYATSDLLVAEILRESTGFAPSLPIELIPTIRLHQDVATLLFWLFLIAYAVLLILQIRTVNMVEWPDHVEMTRAGRAVPRSPLIPVAVGVAMLLAIFFGWPKLIMVSNRVLFTSIVPRSRSAPAAALQPPSSPVVDNLEGQTVPLHQVEPEALRDDLFTLRVQLGQYQALVGTLPILREGEYAISSSSVLTEKGWESEEHLTGQRVYFRGSELTFAAGRATYLYQPSREGKFYQIDIIVDGQSRYCLAELARWKGADQYLGSCAAITVP